MSTTLSPVLPLDTPDRYSDYCCKDNACDACADDKKGSNCLNFTHNYDINQYSVAIPYKEFFDHFLSPPNDMWSEWYAKEVFGSYIRNDGTMLIGYKYLDCNMRRTTIKWRLVNMGDCPADKDTGLTKTAYKVRLFRYSASTPEAVWWCNLTDNIEPDN
jgi:hypothetical protein